jgi:pyruvate dehydrogenase E1 component beta subunit
MPELTYREAVRDALSTAMRQDDDVFIMGEDIAEMGGSMGVTAGMLDEFGKERVRNTPISEMALAARRSAPRCRDAPVAEIMYEDFMTLAAEQVVNQAAKLRYMSGGQLTVPVVVPHAGRRRWSPGAQHAQQLEAWFVHIPGSRWCSHRRRKMSAAPLVRDLRRQPVVFFEHRTLYRSRATCRRRSSRSDRPRACPPRGRRRDRDRDGPARPREPQAAEEAERDGISVEVVDPRTLQPLDEETLVSR